MLSAVLREPDRHDCHQNHPRTVDYLEEENMARDRVWSCKREKGLAGENKSTNNDLRRCIGDKEKQVQPSQTLCPLLSEKTKVNSSRVHEKNIVDRDKDHTELQPIESQGVTDDTCV